MPKQELYYFRIENNANCIYCDESDSVSHTFLHCLTFKSFFNETWFNDIHTTSYPLSPEELLFRVYNNKQSPHFDNLQKKLRYFLSFARYYLNGQKMNKNNIKWEEFNYLQIMN